MKVPIKDIKVGERLRRSVGDIDKLALSINKYGLLHPIVVDRELNLIAGFRRLQACILLKWTEVEVRYMEELNAFQKKEIELEENLMRLDLTWQEQVFAKKMLDELKKKIYGSAFYVEGGWAIEDTANTLGESTSITGHDIMLAKAIEVMPELSKAKSKAEAFKKLKQEKDKVNRDIKVRKLEAELEGKPHDEMIQVIQGDSVKVLRDMESETFDLCIADPPFGVGLDSMAQACEVSISSYKDTEQAMFEKVRIIVKEVSRVLKPNSHMYLFFPIGINYPWFYNLLMENFEYVDPIPLNWYKGTGGYTVNQRYRYMPVYQPIFFATKGKKELSKGMKNVFTSEPVRQKQHIAEMPSELMEILIEQSTLPGENIIDPFAGSGPVGVAAKRLKRRATLIEEKEDNVKIIKERILEA